MMLGCTRIFINDLDIYKCILASYFAGDWYLKRMHLTCKNYFVFWGCEVSLVIYWDTHHMLLALNHIKHYIILKMKK